MIDLKVNRLKGDIHADDVNKHRGSWMSKHSKSALNYGSPLHKDKTGDELKQEGKDLKQEGRDLKKEGRQKKRKQRQNERTVKYGERQLKSKLAANQKQIDKDAKSKELTVMPVDDGNMGNVTGKRSVTKNKTVTKKDGKRTVKKIKDCNKITEITDIKHKHKHKHKHKQNGKIYPNFFFRSW